VKSTNRIFESHKRYSRSARKSGRRVSGADARIQCWQQGNRWSPTCGKPNPCPFWPCCVHHSRKLSTRGLKDIVGAAKKYLWSKIARISPLHIRAERGQKRSRCDERRCETADNLNEMVAIDFAPPNEASITGCMQLYPALQGRVHGSQGPIVRLNTGWFSDRSACYLAAGRP